MIELPIFFSFLKNKKTFPAYISIHFLPEAVGDLPREVSGAGISSWFWSRFRPQLRAAFCSERRPVCCPSAHCSAFFPPGLGLRRPCQGVCEARRAHQEAPVVMNNRLSMPEGLEFASWRVHSALSWNPGSSGWPCLRSIMSSGIGSVCLQSGHALQPRKSSSVAWFVLTVMGCPHSGQFFDSVLGCIFPLPGPYRIGPVGRPLAGRPQAFLRSSYYVPGFRVSFP